MRESPSSSSPHPPTLYVQEELIFPTPTPHARSPPPSSPTLNAGELHFDVVGVVFQMGSIFTESFRLCLIQILLQNRGIKLNPITTLYYIAPACFAFLLIPFSFLELPVLMAATHIKVSLGLLVASAASAFGGCNVPHCAVRQHTVLHYIVHHYLYCTALHYTVHHQCLSVKCEAGGQVHARVCYCQVCSRGGRCQAMRSCCCQGGRGGGDIVQTSFPPGHLGSRGSHSYSVLPPTPPLALIPQPSTCPSSC